MFPDMCLGNSGISGAFHSGRFILSPTQTTWTIGRCPPIDIRAGLGLRPLIVCHLFLSVMMLAFGCSMQNRHLYLCQVTRRFPESMPRQEKLKILKRTGGSLHLGGFEAFGQVNRQGCFTFLQDLGSAHGTLLNGQKLLGTFGKLLNLFLTRIFKS